MVDQKRQADSKLARQPVAFLRSEHTRKSSSAPHPLRLVGLSLLVLLAGFVAIQLQTIPPALPPQLQVAKSARLPAPARLLKQDGKTPETTEPLIRVNVTPGGTDSFRLEIRGQYKLSGLDTNPNSEVSLKLPPGPMTVEATRTGMKLGTVETSLTQIEIVPVESPAIRVDGHLYRGRMRLFRRTDGKVSAVNVLPIEEYLASVVDSEMPAKFPAAAREAQAIVARTYALYQAQHADPKSVFDLFSSQRSQKYLGVEYVDKNNRRLAGESQSSRRAVRETRGIVCKLDEKLFCTYYSAVCGGQTINGKEVFKDATEALKSTQCEWCRESPHYRWTTELSRDAFEARALTPKEKPKLLTIHSIQQLVEPGQGSICQFKLKTPADLLAVNGIQLRDRMPVGTLPSPHFHVMLEKDKVIFKGRGHGHGVGFCQWGAKGQAEAGRSSSEIIRHYFAGAKLTTLKY
ncbi:SpoIID/LytB domain-containing protein [Schlesneria sp. DSM 10557]|uniref:SpoIID/LytB domain-containing protein n=1 Tax=Schlesneria sp. DSM 10557 TaxID=3044399 RepID=UPI0035A1B950